MIDKPLLGEDTYLDPLFADGLVGCWLFNENPPALGKVYDVSGNDNHGTLVADVYGIPGKFGPTLEFDGTGDYVNCGTVGNLIAGKTQATILAWVKGDSATPTTDRGICGNYGAGTENALIWWKTSQDLTCRFYISGAKDDGIVDAITDTDWHQVVSRYNGVEVEAFVDAIGSGGPTAASGAIDSGSSDFMIGQIGTIYPWDGQIDHLMIWDRALSQNEIEQLYTEPFWGFKQRDSGIYTRI